MISFFLLLNLFSFGEQKNITFKNIPDFLRGEWAIVLEASEEKTVETGGSVLLGNQIVIFSDKKKAKTIADYIEFNVNKVIQYNIDETKSSTGYITLFQISSAEGEIIVRPHSDFWIFSIRKNNSKVYQVYSAINLDNQAKLKKLNSYNTALDSEKKLLRIDYKNYSSGIVN